MGRLPSFALTPYLKGALAGGAFTAALGLAYAFGQSQAGVALADEAAVKAALERGQCRVEVGYGSMTGSDECMFDKVMVGTRGEYILCADVDVTCQDE